jgi:Domain of unknown function (DUF4260)
MIMTDISPSKKPERNMAILLKTEELAITGVSIYFLTQHHSGFPAWSLILLFFAPDISILAYLKNAKVGAYFYNLFHNRAIGLALVAMGMIFHYEGVIMVGTIIFAHSSFDRMMGYGLKYTDHFKHTSLGWM